MLKLIFFVYSMYCYCRTCDHRQLANEYRSKYKLTKIVCSFSTKRQQVQIDSFLFKLWMSFFYLLTCKTHSTFLNENLADVIQPDCSKSRFSIPPESKYVLNRILRSCDDALDWETRIIFSRTLVYCCCCYVLFMFGILFLLFKFDLFLNTLKENVCYLIAFRN